MKYPRKSKGVEIESTEAEFSNRRKIPENIEYTEAEFRHPRKKPEVEFLLMLQPESECMRTINFNDLITANNRDDN